MRLFLAISCLLILFSSSAQVIKSGTWSGQIHYASTAIPFNFEVSYPTGDVPQITFINGAERRVISNTKIIGDTLIIPMEPFDVAIRTSFGAMQMTGVYEKYYRGSRYGFSATFGSGRFKKTQISANATIGSTYSMQLNPRENNETEAIGLFEQKGAIVTGTILTTVSDYRFFEGIVDGDSLKLSSFDGAHAFMLLGKKDGNSWSGELIYDDNYSEKWIAELDEEAELPDPFEMVTVEPARHKPYYDLLAAGSGKNALDPKDYRGKVTIIQLFGTWCPNSHDQTKFLVEWYGENKERDVQILASSFEANYSQPYGLRRIREYKERNDIPYKVVLGGRLSKAAAAMSFPFIQKIEAFPTLIFLDKEGYVRYVHSYFNGPATGNYYEQFKKRFNEIVNELINED